LGNFTKGLMDNLNNNNMVSLIMPTFNRDFIIELAIQSIINQKEHTWNIELLIGDDGNDDTEELIKNIDNTNSKLEIKYIKMERIALSDKLNYLVELSKGIFYGIIGSDDFQSLHKISTFEKCLELNPTGDVFGQRKFIYHDIIFNKTLLWTQNKDLQFFKAGSFLILKKSIFEDNNGYEKGLWRSVDSSLSNKIDWSKLKLIDVETENSKVINSSIAIQHIDNIWRRKSKGFRRKQKQTKNYLTQTVDINIEKEMDCVFETYSQVKSAMLENLSFIQKIFLILKK